MRLKCCLLAITFFFLTFSVNAEIISPNDPRCRYDQPYIPSCAKTVCCGDMGGINYCDSSAGRYVCNNGYFSSCYCTRHAVMDLQKLQGCCLWQGGVFSTDETGLVICNNGGISQTCSGEPPYQPISSWQ
ncbi:TPA: neurogenic locus notch [Legionella feeleii]|uniref:Neurogenic locus notch like protein n=1 Tax=Legionella feeleii TaxID=453 RepID=A0A378IWD5_9GAMM|nr:hypothetical protein [Legionella feeleii]STX38865.1 neurogenic locus notch like protein precursor [Legionella feeleii]